MGARCWRRGHDTEWDEEAKEWRYADTGEIADYDRPCIKCGEMPTPDGYDPCIGYIEGATGACCGHGVFQMSVMYPEDLLAAEEQEDNA